MGPFSASRSIRAMVWTVLPSPISSARQAPAPHSFSRAIQRKPSSWYCRSSASRVEGISILSESAFLILWLSSFQPLSVLNEATFPDKSFKMWVAYGLMVVLFFSTCTIASSSFNCFFSSSVRAMNSPLASSMKRPCDCWFFFSNSAMESTVSSSICNCPSSSNHCAARFTLRCICPNETDFLMRKRSPSGHSTTAMSVCEAMVSSSSRQS